MQWYKADMHIHTVLSPCGGLDMSPVNIIRQAVMKKLDIIAITDHNSTKHCQSAQEIGKKNGILVLAGAEINSKEEIHCLAFFEDTLKTKLFQRFIDENLEVIPNKPEVFGNQYLVDENEDILEEEKRLLVVALKKGIDEISEKVKALGGIFIPAHVNRKNNGIYSQLGFLPGYLKFDALEIAHFHGFENFLEDHPETAGYCLVTNSDAHSLGQIGTVTTDFYLETPSFHEIRQALRHENNRKVKAL
jgi:PHP family Zn ribbon phosphoesterase